MEAIFLQILKMSIIAGCLVPVVFLLRLCLRKAPKWLHCLLWSIVGARLVIPSLPKSSVSLIPGPQTLPEFTVPEQPISAAPAVSYLTIAGYIWLAGILIMLCYGAVSYLRLRWQVRVSLRSGNAYLCDDIDTPFILGFFRPRIYIPSDLDAQQLPHVLAHEQAHLHRRDHWWKPLGYLILSVYWFHPLLWVGYIFLCRDIEQACDEKVIRNMDTAAQKGYCEALISCSIHRRAVLSCPLAFGELAVKERIKSVLHYKKPVIWVVGAAIVISVVTAVCFLTDPKPCQHTYVQGCVQTPTCTREGTMEYTCVNCADSYTEPIAMMAHHYGEAFVTKEPNCSRQGEKSATCIDCGCTQVVQTLPQNEVHNLKNTQLKAPTCTDPGAGVNRCTRCSYEESCTYELAAHDFKDGATCAGNCTFPQQTQQICRNCGLYEWKDTGPKTGKHSWRLNGTCVFCGIKDPDYSYPVKLPVTYGNSGGTSVLDGTVNPDKSNGQLPVIRWDPYPGAPPDFSFLYP